MARQRLFIAVEAIIGVGKSTFTKELQQYLNEHGHEGAVAQFEPVDSNPFLVPFYEDMKRWAYTMQVNLLHARYKMHQQAACADVTIIQDRSLFGDVCFARLAQKLDNMTADEFESYEMARANMMMHMVYPDIVIYLDISAAHAHRRLQRRNQTGDTSIPLSYLEGLRTEYEHMVAGLGTHCPVVRVMWSDFTDGEIAERVGDTWEVAREHVRGDWTRRQAV